MPGDFAPSSRAEFGQHLLLFDGACGLCHGLVQNVLQRDRRGVFHFASIQSPAAKAQMARFDDRPSHFDTLVVIVNYRGEPSAQLTKARAALFVLTVLGWPWRTAALLRVLPIALLDQGYDAIARNRYRFFSRRDSCLVARPEYQSRFPGSEGDLAPKREVW